ncbi:hypothetical protein F2Z80_25270 [Vibrio fortis]|uniref:Uncharacterized protein n=1 Tax=Vibrio fortis TaxID=212667 RepID=A0A5N3RZR1_9VIBR|nr:hypothetical protein [Vibrio fortis]KAB0299140.1 hypothetical protein F2Z80_25210 [Vibrio fortis]KAB0299151.1 hypothetical protein F2Z80_25270 [Vibrio fortis]
MNFTIALKAALRKLTSRYIKLESTLNDPASTTYQIKMAKKAYFKALAELDEVIREIQSLESDIDEVSAIMLHAMDEVRGMLGVIFALSQSSLTGRTTPIEGAADGFMLRTLSRHIYDLDEYATSLETNQFTKTLLDAVRGEQFKNVSKAPSLR